MSETSKDSEAPPPPPPEAEEALPPPPAEEDASHWEHSPPPLEKLHLSDEELRKAHVIDAQIRIGQLAVADCAPIGTRRILQLVAEMQQGPIPARALISMAIFFYEHDCAARKDEDKKEKEADDLELELCTIDTPQIKAFLLGVPHKATYSMDEINTLLLTKLNLYDPAAIQAIIKKASNSLKAKTNLNKNLGFRLSLTGLDSAVSPRPIRPLAFKKFVEED